MCALIFGRFNNYFNILRLWHKACGASLRLSLRSCFEPPACALAGGGATLSYFLFLLMSQAVLDWTHPFQFHLYSIFVIVLQICLKFFTKVRY